MSKKPISKMVIGPAEFVEVPIPDADTIRFRINGRDCIDVKLTDNGDLEIRHGIQTEARMAVIPDASNVIRVRLIEE